MNNNTQHRVFIFLERLWLCAAIMGIILTIYFLVQRDNDSALFFLAFFILCGLFFVLRRRQRIRHQSRHGIK